MSNEDMCGGCRKGHEMCYMLEGCVVCNNEWLYYYVLATTTRGEAMEMVA